MTLVAALRLPVRRLPYFLPFALSKRCPRCRSESRRCRTPFLLRPFRLLFPDRTHSRWCYSCEWRGIVFERRPEGPDEEILRGETEEDVF